MPGIGMRPTKFLSYAVPTYGCVAAQTIAGASKQLESGRRPV